MCCLFVDWAIDRNGQKKCWLGRTNWTAPSIYSVGYDAIWTFPFGQIKIREIFIKIVMSAGRVRRPQKKKIFCVAHRHEALIIEMTAAQREGSRQLAADRKKKKKVQSKLELAGCCGNEASNRWRSSWRPRPRKRIDRIAETHRTFWRVEKEAGDRSDFRPLRAESAHWTTGESGTWRCKMASSWPRVEAMSI